MNRQKLELKKLVGLLVLIYKMSLIFDEIVHKCVITFWSILESKAICIIVCTTLISCNLVALVDVEC